MTGEASLFGCTVDGAVSDNILLIPICNVGSFLEVAMREPSNKDERHCVGAKKDRYNEREKLRWGYTDKL